MFLCYSKHTFLFVVPHIIDNVVYVIHRVRISSKCVLDNHPLMLLHICLWWRFLLITIHNTSLLNPGPLATRKTPLKIFHWNANSIVAHNKARIFALEALNITQNYDLICITENALHKSISDDFIHLEGYNPIRIDFPDGVSHGGVLLYYRESLAVRERPDLGTHSNMLVCEVTIDRRKIIISVTYRKHHDSKPQLENFMGKFKEMCELVAAEKPFCSLHIGDLNSRSSQWWSGDTDNDAGNLLVSVLNNTGLH